MLASAGFAVELLYTAESSYAVPALLEKGLQDTYLYASAVWAAGPALGLFFQTYLGAASDRCRCSWGRRRPFVLALAISVTVCTALFAYGGQLLGFPRGGRASLLTAAVAFIGMDFSLDQFGSAVRMYLLDSAALESNHTANYMYVVMLCLGTLVGAVIGAVNWESPPSDSGVQRTSNLGLEHQVEVVFGMALIVFVVCLVLVLCSVDERLQMKSRKLNLEIITRNTLDSYGHDKSTEYLAVRQSEMLPEMSITQPDGERDGWTSLSSVTVSLRSSAEFLQCLSLSMKLLWSVTFLDWMVFLGKTIFLTDYVGTVVYGGSLTSDDEAAVSRYEAGVRMACWCTMLGDAITIVYSLTLEWLSELTGHKFLLVGGHFLCFAALGLAVLQPSLASTVILCIAGSIFAINLEAIPYALILYYKV